MQCPTFDLKYKKVNYINLNFKFRKLLSCLHEKKTYKKYQYINNVLLIHLNKKKIIFLTGKMDTNALRKSISIRRGGGLGVQPKLLGKFGVEIGVYHKAHSPEK